MGLFSNPPSSPSRLGSASIATLGATQVSLTVLEKLMDSFPLPVIKGVAGAGVEVIKIARAIQSNKRECEELQKRSASLLVVLFDSLIGKTEDQIPGPLKQALERLTGNFYEVIGELKVVDKRSGKRSLAGFGRALVYHQDNAETLKDCSAKLEWAIHEFQVASKVDSCLKDLERHQELIKGQTELRDGQADLREGQKEILSAVKEKSTTSTMLNLPSIVMPANPRIYGRDKYVSTAVLLVLSGNATRLAILGPGGMGKTSVALKIVYDPKIVAHFAKNIHWTPCEQATSIPLLIELLAKTLHLPTSSSHDRFEEVILALENSTSVHLFLLDNFETPWDIPGKQSEVADILARLASIPSVSIILTMRGSLPPASDMVEWSDIPFLTQLDLAAAREAFLRLCPGGANDKRLDTLLNELDYMPLAIKLMAKLAQGGESPSDLLLQWRSERTGLLSRPGGDRRNSIDVSIKLSLDSHLMRATPDAVRLLSVLAMLPAGGCVARIPNLCPSIANWKGALRILHNAALTYDGPDRTFVHVLSPIRSYIQVHHPLDETGWKDLQDSYCQLAEKGKSQPGDGNPLYFDNLKEIAQEEANLETILISSLKGSVEEAVIRACLDYTNYCYWTHVRTTVIAAAVDAARVSRSKLLAQCLLAYGDMLHMQDKRNEAIPILEEARAEYAALGLQSGAAQCLQTLGDIHYLQSNFGTAGQTLMEAKSVFLDLDDQYWAAHCLQSTGKVFMAEGKNDEARISLEDARAKFQAVDSQLGGAQCLWLLGKLLSIEGEYDQARALLEEARALSLSHGDQLCATQCLQELAILLRHEEKYDQAIPLLEEAKARFMASQSQFGKAQCLEQLGQIFYKQGKYDEAIELVEEAQAIYVGIGNPQGNSRCQKFLERIA